uniref:Uncharacterized protein n=2 Tax=Rhizophagus irregularis TaxID=588596 RepID=U9TA79_RHIID
MLLSLLSPFSLPINKAVLTYNDLVELIKDLFEQIKWVFDSQIESQKSLKQNCKREAESAKHKVRIEKLEKNSADISAENAELKAELAKLRHNFDFSNLTRPQQSQHVINMQNSCSVREEDISLVTAVSQPDAKPENHLASNDISDPVIDQHQVNELKKRKTDAFLGEVYKKSVSNDIRQRNRKKKLLHK